MALRVGIDLVSAAVVEESVRAHGERYLKRIYTQGELDDCREDARRLAARFAAKEAMLKVLRPGREDSLPWREIEVVRKASGWVDLALSGRAAARAAELGVTELAVSLTHEGSYASAVVIAQLDIGGRG